jgi:hypothetical protein
MPRKQTGYAVGTQVPPEKSQQEIVALLRKNGATQHFFGEDERRAIVGFSTRGRQIRFTIPYPVNDPLGRDAEIRRRWRCLLISIKAKFENVAVAESLSPEHADNVFRAEFLAETVLRDGQTVAEVVLPMVDRNYSAGAPLRLLPGLGDDE